MEMETERLNMQELLTREERDRLAERLLPGEKILWQGKSRCGWRAKAAKEWPGMLFSVFFAAAWGRGFYTAASAPVWTGEVIFALVIMGICCFSGVGMFGLLVINAGRANAGLHALTNMRLFSLGPSADGKGVLFRQWNGGELRKIRLISHQDGTGDLIFRYRFPPNGKPEPLGCLSLPEAETVCEQITRAFPAMSVSRFP